MTVKELIERLEEFPEDCPVVAGDNAEIIEAVERDELYLTEGHYYDEGPVIKLY